MKLYLVVEVLEDAVVSLLAAVTDKAEADKLVEEDSYNRQCLVAKIKLDVFLDFSVPKK